MSRYDGAKQFMQDVHKTEAALQLATGSSWQQAADALGLSRATINRYMNDPEFRERVRRLSSDLLTFDMPRIDRVMVDKAIGGNIQAATFIAKRIGALTDVTEDKTFSDFVKKLEGADADSVQFFMDNGRWPDTDAAEMMPEPEQTQ